MLQAETDPLDMPPEAELIIESSDNVDLAVSHYPAKGDTLIIWVGSSYSFSNRIYKTAHLLAKNNFEIWQVDFSEIFFEPKTSNFLRNLDAQYVAELVNAAHEKTGKQIILMARAYGAIPSMRGATLWQQQNPDKDFLKGVILFSPDFFASIPELGLDPEYLPITRYTTIPTIIYQGGRRGTAWQFPRLLKQLTSSNRHLYFSYMKGVSGVFYRNDHDPATLAELNRLPETIKGAIKLLQHTTGYEIPKNYKQDHKVKYESILNAKLKKFQGDPEPKAFNLKDINGEQVKMDNFKGQVTVVNFWATWCPPCVEEIPSLNRLRKKMSEQSKPGRKFELISINYAEPKSTIDKFLKQINVEFPVLLDLDGNVSRQWNVIAFPSTFIVGPDGKIQYGINSAIRWDSPEVIKLLNSLH